MKRTISIFASALLVLVAATSCSNKGDDKLTTDTGKMELTIGYATTLPENAGGRAYTESTARPGTSWTNNVQDMMILCVDASKIVRAVKIADLTTKPSGMDVFSKIYSGIPAGTYTIYAVANAMSTGAIAGYIGTTPETWNDGNILGKNIDNLLLKLIRMSTQPTVGIPSTAGYTCYNVPAEIFVGSTAVPVQVKVDETTAPQQINLTRAIGLMRVRIDKTANGNENVDFATTTPSKGMVQVRLATQEWSLGTRVTASPRLATNVIYKNQAFSTQPTPADYSGNMNLTGGISCWSDIRMFPGGSESTTIGTNKFDILISGIAPLGYETFEGTVTTNATTPVYWSGQVTGLVVANEILEVNCTLLTKGSTTPPEIGSYGWLEVNVNLMPWGAIKSTNVPM